MSDYLKRPYPRILRKNLWEEFFEKAELIAKDLSKLEGVVGITLTGGLSRDYADEYSEIDLIVYFEKNAFKEWLYAKASLPEGDSKYKGSYVDIKYLCYEDELKNEWSHYKKWDSSYAKILYDPQGLIKKLLQENTSLSEKEKEELIDRYFVVKWKPETFIAALKSTLKQKSFRYWIIIFFGFVVVTNSLTASIPYAVFFVMGGDETDAILLFASFLNGALISVPIWIYINKRLKNNKKSAVIGGITLFCGLLIVFFFDPMDKNIIFASMIMIFILGFTMGNLWALTSVYFADVLDERVAITRSPVRGTTVGVHNFFFRLSRGAQIAIFAIVHILTGFVAGSQSQSELAKLGIRLHMTVIPAI
ncbi:MAG: MFS transporter, partial [Candidatus Wukongarchaeota archaeon]|nr:MFS transporter [Candidatus Wukongarchaeota archaeon]